MSSGVVRLLFDYDALVETMLLLQAVTGIATIPSTASVKDCYGEMVRLLTVLDQREEVWGQFITVQSHLVPTTGDGTSETWIRINPTERLRVDGAAVRAGERNKDGIVGTIGHMRVVSD